MDSITLISSDNVKFQVPLKHVKKSTTISNMFESLEDSQSSPIPLMVIDSEVLKIIIEFWNIENENELDSYIKTFSNKLVQKVLTAADFLDETNLLILCCKHIARLLTGKTTEEMRLILDIESDFTPEEEEEAKIEKNFFLSEIKM
jgi:S-phase kinase-associated protein 1